MSIKKPFSLLALYYLRFWAKTKLSQIKPTIIGVTGSAGKTSTVAAIETVLAQKYQVKSTAGANSESGIPLSILGLKMTDYSLLDWLRVIILAPFAKTKKYEILVCEMGIDELTPPKNMDYLLSIVRPKIGVFLNVLPVHTEQMRSEEKIAAEKGKLITSLPAEGTAILNSHDKLVMEFKNKTKARVITFDGTSLGAANAIAKVFHLPTIRNFPAPAGRGRVFAGINNSILIDQSYNSSRVPAILALESLAMNKKELFLKRTLLKKNSSFQVKRTIAALGDMRELGTREESEHKILAKEAYRLADEVISVGPLTKKYFPQNPKLIAHFETSSQAGKFLQKHLKSGDVVLFKGSQNTIFLETAVEMCLANPNDAAFLPRRGKFWDKQRSHYIS